MKSTTLSVSLVEVYVWALATFDAAAVHEVLAESEMPADPDWMDDPDYACVVEGYVGELMHEGVPS